MVRLGFGFRLWLIKLPSVKYNSQMSVLLWLLVLQVVIAFISAMEAVQIFHVIDNALWGEIDGSGLQGDFPCASLSCRVVSPRKGEHAFDDMKKQYDAFLASGQNAVTVS